MDMLTFFLILPISVTLLLSCNHHDDPIVGRTISGIVIDMPFMFLGVPGVTVEAVESDPDSPCRCECWDDGRVYRTTTDATGRWKLQDVPFKYIIDEDTEMTMKAQFFIKMTHPNYPLAYNPYLSDFDGFNTMMLNPLIYDTILAQYELITGGTVNRNEMSLIFGLGLGFTYMDYPQILDPLGGVTVSAVYETRPADIDIPVYTYPGFEVGVPTDDLGGMFFAVVEDATRDGIPVIKISGEKPGRAILAGDTTTCPGAFVMAAVIDPFYIP